MIETNDYVAIQLQREKELNERAYKKWKDELKLQEKKGDGGNTPYGRKFMNYYFDDIVSGLQNEINNPNLPRSSYATKVIKECLGLTLTYKKDKRTKEKIIQTPNEKANFFDLDLAVYMALTLMIENALAPAMKEKIIDKKTGQEKVVFPAVDRTALIEKIAVRVEKQIYYKYIQTCFPDYFDKLDKLVAGGGDKPRSSSYYWRVNMDRALRNKADSLRLEGRNTEADAYDFKPFGADRKHIGSWLLGGVLKYSNLFEEHKRNIDGKTRKIFITLTPEAEQFKHQYIKKQSKIIIDDMPMICPPVQATDENFGSWLLSADIHKPQQHKGELKTSPLFLEYVNHLQGVKYKINPFIVKLMEYLVEHNDKLGKFKPHQYQEPLDMAQALGVIRTGDYAADRATLRSKGEEWKQERRRYGYEKSRQLKKVDDGRKSKVVFQAAKELLPAHNLYFPHMWDFRSRAYSLCKTTPEPQGTDYQKAALMFADAQPIDKKTKFWLSVEIANNAGKDKISFGKRVEWVEKNIDNIVLVGSMFEKNNEPEAIKWLQRFNKEEPWQLAAACEEYYQIFIKKSRRTTSIRCGVDMSCSAAGIHAGWKRDAADAEAVNITPSNTPQDLYMRVWKHLLKVNRSKDTPPIRPALLEAWTDQGYGRKVAKKMIMVFQYSAGIRKQMSEFYQIHDDMPEELQMTRDETKALWKLWQQTTAESMSVDSVINWFQDRAKEIAAMGKNFILIPNAAGVVQVMKYPKVEKTKQVVSFHNGRFTEYQSSDLPDTDAWKRAITANATHMTDSAIMVLALHDFPYAFSTIHDAAHTYATGAMDMMLERLKDGYIKAVEMDIWDEFRRINGLPIDATTDFPKTNTLDLEVVRQSSYIFA